MTATEKKRPRGVTIIGILDLIGGIIGIFGGLALTAAGAIFMGVSEDFEIPLGALENLGISEEFFGLIILAFGVFILGLGIALIIAAYGTFKAKGWAWPFNVVLAIISIVTDVASMVLGGFEVMGLIVDSVSIGIALVILYYLYRPHVKAFFGRSVPTTATTS